jgi:hypothetical protein
MRIGKQTPPARVGGKTQAARYLEGLLEAPPPFFPPPAMRIAPTINPAPKKQ